MTKKEINREAGDKVKGFFFQRMRAVLLLLQKIKENPNTNILIATEYKGDIYLKDDFIEYSEEDKNYSSMNFSFFSAQVQNTIVYFLDIWENAKHDPNINFGFYSTNSIAKESLTKKIKELGISKLPDKPILILIPDKKWDYPNLMEPVTKVIFKEFEDQYNVSIEDKFNNDDLINFLDRINWNFDEEDIDKLEEKIIDEIRRSHFCSTYNLAGREKAVFHGLLYELEKRQNTSHITQRFINQDKVEVVFLRELNQQNIKVINDFNDLRSKLDKLFEIQKKVYGEKYFVTTKNPTN